MPFSTQTPLPEARTSYLPFGRPNFGDEEIAAVTRVMKSGWVGMGPEVISFESELQAFLSAGSVVTVSSCTAALHLALLAVGVKPGDEVIVPSLTWCSSANAIIYAGAVPVFCDIEPDSLSVSSRTILAAVTPKTKAVIVVHFGGLAVDVQSVREALPKSVSIIEDAAHALGATYPEGGLVGSSGNPVCFSFYANKNLSTGEGGAVALGDQEGAELIRSLRQHGLPTDAWKRFTHPKAIGSGEIHRLGFKANYTDLQAAIGRVQLRRQPEFAAIRIGIARRYESRLSLVAPGFSSQLRLGDGGHSRHLFVAKLPAAAGRPRRDALLISLRARNIGASVHYLPLHQMPYYSGFAHSPLGVTDEIAPRLITLPISASMTEADAEDVLCALESAWAEVVATIPPSI